MQFWLTRNGNDYKLWDAQPTPEQIAGEMSGIHQVATLCPKVERFGLVVEEGRCMALDVALTILSVQ